MKWSIALIVAVVIGGVGAVAFILGTHPADDASNAEIVSSLVLDLLVLGLVIFVIRFVAIQARGHRHMQFVCKNKANALSTFNRITAGQEDPDVRANVAAALAQAVFKSDDGIFSDASGDTVTIVERAIGAVSTRTPPGS